MLLLSTPEALWHQHFPDVPLTEPTWLERCDAGLLPKALAITAKKDKAGRFKIRTQQNIGRYLNGVIRKLKNGEDVCSNNETSVPMTLRLTVKRGYKITEEDKKRFDEKIVKSDDCLLFTGAKHQGGYGRFRVNGKLLGAHVFGFFEEIGHLPAEGSIDWTRLNVAHNCRNRNCCNPRHLRLKSKDLNLDERVYRKQKENSKPNTEDIAPDSLPSSTVLPNTGWDAACTQQTTDNDTTDIRESEHPPIPLPSDDLDDDILLAEIGRLARTPDPPPHLPCRHRGVVRVKSAHDLGNVRTLYRVHNLYGWRMKNGC